MYQNNRELKREQKKDIKKLYADLLNDPASFSVGLSWLGQKALDSEEHRSVEAMWMSYLLVMKKLDRKLFSAKLYIGRAFSRIYPVFRMLFVEQYSEVLIALSLGAANLMEQVKSRGYRGKAEDLRWLADKYKKDVTEALVGKKEFTYEVMWKLIRRSNLFFAGVYDIVDSATFIAGCSRCATYSDELRSYDPKPYATSLYHDTFEKLFDPKGYKKRMRTENFRRFKNRVKRRYPIVEKISKRLKR